VTEAGLVIVTFNPAYSHTEAHAAAGLLFRYSEEDGTG
jgi:hypothetical protein